MKYVISGNSTDEAEAASAWCSQHVEFGDEIIAVVGIDQVSEMLLSFTPLMELTEVVEGTDVLTRDDVRQLQSQGVLFRKRVMAEAPSKAVVDVAHQEAADLIVIGKRPHSALVDLITNDAASQLVHHPPCPVVIVPTGAVLASR